MVDSVLQRFARQFNANHLAIRSAKLPINVLLDHWHHVRTTDTVIVVSSYKIYPFFFHTTPDRLLTFCSTLLLFTLRLNFLFRIFIQSYFRLSFS